MERVLYTVGHSTHSLKEFTELLEQHSVNAVADVRSSPYSRRNPQFNREGLQDELSRRGIAYVFLGGELGARSSDPRCYREGKVQYNRLAATDSFRSGLERLKKGVDRYRLALVCAESDPLQCHRTILVCQQLKTTDLEILHILKTGEVESHRDAEERLLHSHRLSQADLFLPRDDQLTKAYALQEARIAYSLPPGTTEGEGR